MTDFFTGIAKLLLEQFVANRNQKIAVRQRSLDNLLLVRKELGANSEVDTQIKVFCYSIAYGCGLLIPKTYIDFAESSSDTAIIFEIFPDVKNFIINDSPENFPVLKKHVSNHDNRKNFKIRVYLFAAATLVLALFSTNRFVNSIDIIIANTFSAQSILDAAIYLLCTSIAFASVAMLVFFNLYKLDKFALFEQLSTRALLKKQPTISDD